MERKILMIDDDFQEVLQIQSLLPQEIVVQHAFNIQDGSRAISQHGFSVVTIKPGTARGASFAFLADLRAARPMPIIVTGTMKKEERKYAYQMGADLCIDAPVDPEELALGIHVQLRRYYTLNRIAQLREADMILRYKGLSIDPLRHIILMDETPVTLLAKEYGILYFLMRNPGIVLTREQIYQHVWKEEHPYGSRSVSDHISAIRKKLGLSPADKEYIETIRHVGYRFAP